MAVLDTVAIDHFDTFASADAPARLRTDLRMWAMAAMGLVPVLFFLVAVISAI